MNLRTGRATATDAILMLAVLSRERLTKLRLDVVNSLGRLDGFTRWGGSVL